MQAAISSPAAISAKPIWNKIQSVHLSLYFKNKESDYAKQAAEAFKATQKKHAKRIGSVNVANSRLIEEQLLPMLVAQDVASGEIVAQVINFVDHFGNKAGLTAENAEKLLRIKGVLEPVGAPGKQFEIKKEEIEHELSVGSSFLLDQLNAEEVTRMNSYIAEKERVIELTLTAQTINYKDCLTDSYRGVEDPFNTEIAELSYNQNPIDPSQVIREIVFKRDEQSTGASLGN